jgi:hypothetical protein
LFSKVDAQPPITPQSAIWHFGWHVTDVRKSLEIYKARPDVKLLPLYTTDEGGFVYISSDTWPGTGGVLGLTKAQIANAKAQDVKPAGGAGFAYMRGPDDAIVEYLGNQPVERMNHVHMWQEQPFCAQLWYQKHLNAAPVAGRSEAATVNVIASQPRPFERAISRPQLPRRLKEVQPIYVGILCGLQLRNRHTGKRNGVVSIYRDYRARVSAMRLT